MDSDYELIFLREFYWREMIKRHLHERRDDEVYCDWTENLRPVSECAPWNCPWMMANADMNK